MSKLYDAIMGLAIGDAFGVPYEFSPRDTINVTEAPKAWGTHNQPAGTWSDDTAMTLATLNALAIKKPDVLGIADEFMAWIKYGTYSTDGVLFDIGARTITALRYYDQTGVEFLEGGIYTNGNGSLMRILPLAFLKDLDLNFVDDVSAITHPHEISKWCCRIYVQLARYIIENPGATILDLKNIIVDLNMEYDNLLNIDAIFKPGPNFKKIKSTGYVVDTLEAVLAVLLDAESFEDAILKAVRLGGDTDTIAAILGGLAGIKWGLTKVRADWMPRNLELITEVIDTASKSTLFIV